MLGGEGRVRGPANAMVRAGRVRNFQAGPRHVAFRAAIRRILDAADGGGQAATVLLMAAETTVPVIGHLLFGCGDSVRVVTGYTAQSSFAPLKTTAPIHLLGVVGDGSLRVDLGRTNKYGQNRVQGDARSIIKE